MAAAPDPLPDEEFVYRRIPWNHYNNPASSPYPRIDAFRPREDETEGISVDRANLTTIDRARRGRSPKPYHVARISVGELRSRFGLTVIPNPIPGNSAHALIPGMSRDVYEQNRPAFRAIAEIIATELAQLVLVALDPDVFPWQE